MLSTLHHQKNKIEEELRELKNSQEETKKAGGKYSELTQKLEEKLEKDRIRREELTKLAELGRKMEALSTEWDKTKDKKAIIKKFVGAMTSEKKKREAENAPHKLAKKKQDLIERLRKEIQVGSKVRMLKSKQAGIVEEIKKDTIVVNFGNMKAKVAIETLELV